MEDFLYTLIYPHDSLEITFCKVLKVFNCGEKDETRMCAKIVWFPVVKQSKNEAGGTLYLKSWRGADGKTCSAIMWEDVMRSRFSLK